MQTLSDAIRRSAWAETLTGAQLDRVLHEGVERWVNAGTVLCSAGSAVDHWLGIIDGLVKLTTWSSDGRSLILMGYAEGAWFGEGSLLRQTPRQYEIVALRKTRVAMIPRPVFSWLLDTSPAFSHFVAAQLNDRLSDFIQRIMHERFSPLPHYIAYCLSTLFDPRVFPDACHRVEMSQRDVGELTGRSRQEVNRALQQLEAIGLIERGYHSVTIRDMEQLRSYGRQGAPAAPH